MNSVVDGGPVVYRARIQAIRDAMREAGVDACVVPSADPHLSEYPPLRWQGRAWLSGFTGSVATLVVTETFAGLWVDSRYWVQAEAELAGTSIALMKLMSGQGNAHIDWLAGNLPSGAVVAIDGNVLALGAATATHATLGASGIALRTDIDLLSRVWTDRPALPAQPVFEHLPPFAPSSRADKLAAVRSAMTRVSADWHLVSTLDDIAWIFNLRGADVSFNPVFVAHALIGPARALLFIDPRKVPEAIGTALHRDGVELAPYEAVGDALRALPAGTTLLVDPRRMTYGLATVARQGNEGVALVEAPNPSALAKAQKTAEEAAHVRETMAHDGAALCAFFAWLEARLADGTPGLTELTIDTELRAARARQPGFVCESFGTIAGFNANGAMPHYRATPAAHAEIVGDGLLLIDSGGQYVGGTTDITASYRSGGHRSNRSTISRPC